MQQLIPAYLSKDEFVAVLEDVLGLVKADDSMEGSIIYETPELTDPDGIGYRVRASYRYGNTMGQGFLRMIGEWRETAVDGEPEELAGGPMTPAHLRRVAEWLDTYDIVAEAYIERRRLDGNVDNEELNKLREEVRGNDVQRDLRRWAEELEQHS